MTHSSKLHWQCRRGMRELDILLERFLCQGYEGSSDVEKSAFQALLALQDPELAGYLLRDVPHDDAISARVIARILGRAET